MSDRVFREQRLCLLSVFHHLTSRENTMPHYTDTKAFAAAKIELRKKEGIYIDIKPQSAFS